MSDTKQNIKVIIGIIFSLAKSSTLCIIIINRTHHASGFPCTTRWDFHFHYDKSAVNQLITLRNWAIGYYIVEYEQDGNDRAEYGINLLKNLETQIDEKGMNITLFKTCRQFYLTYLQIYSTVSNQFKLSNIKKSPTVSNEFVTSPEKLVSRLSFSHISEIMVIKDSF